MYHYNVQRAKLIVAQLVKNFPAFYATQRFFTAFTKAPNIYLYKRDEVTGENYIMRSFIICTFLQV
jgi:hypothetical protein